MDDLTTLVNENPLADDDHHFGYITKLGIIK
jgi:hypothetical protein